MKENINITNSKIAISTDTSCTISKDLASKENIFVFPLNVIVNGEEFLDGVTITQDQLLKDMRGGKSIKTSTPPLSQIEDYFKGIFAQGYDYIVHFTISSKLSSMFSLFSNVSRDAFDNKVIVIDSYSVCSLMLSHVLFCKERLSKGFNLDIVVKEVNDRLNDNYVRFIPENLNALKNGGRISPTIAAICNTIGLKPVLSMQEGSLGKDSMARNQRKKLNDLLLESMKDYPLNRYDFTLVSFDGDKKVIETLQETFKEHNPDTELKVLPIAINVCAHCGPGTIGLIVSPKIDNHSLNEYLD